MKETIGKWKFLTFSELTSILLLTVLLLAATSTSAISALNLSMTASPDPVRPGELITYRYTITNTGTEDLTGVTLTTIVPDETDSSERVITGGGQCSDNICREGAVVTWSFVTVLNGQSRTVEMVVGVDSVFSGPPDGTIIVNSARVEEDGGDNDTAEQSVIIDSTPVLTVEIAEDREPIEPGDVLTYTVTFGNRGVVNAPGVTLIADVPVGTAFVSASDGGTQVDGMVSWSLNTLNAGESGRRQFRVTVDSGLADGSILFSKAEIEDTASPDDSARAAVTTVVHSGTPLTLSMTASPDPVRPGELITYRYTITNVGTTDLTGVTLTTIVPDETDSSERVITGGGQCSDNLCREGAVITWSFGTVLNGQSRTVEMVLQVDSGSSAPPGGMLIYNVARVKDDNENSAVLERSVLVDTTPVLVLGMTESENPVNSGGLLTYNITFGNRGSVNAPGVTLSAIIPTNTTFVSASNGGINIGGIVKWTLGTVEIGKSGQRQFTVSVNSGLADGSILFSEAEITDTSSLENNARATAAPVVFSGAPLILSVATATIEIDKTVVRQGGLITYRYTVSNTGTEDLTGIELIAIVPDETESDERSITDGGQCSDGLCREGAVVTWSLGTIFAGRSRMVDMVARVDSGSSAPPDGTIISNFARVKNDNEDNATADAVTRICAAGGRACDHPIPPRCNGLFATIIGTLGNDIINGTNGRDVIHGLAGSDTIKGFMGNDVICGGDGNDSIGGDRGNDLLFGQGGSDVLDGSFDADQLFGSLGNDTLRGASGNDVLFGGPGIDTLQGGFGLDTLDGGIGNDTLNGNQDNDTLRGGNGSDRLNGGLGTDTCNGGTGSDTGAGCETVIGIP